jgi:hypothetical protein
VVEINRAVEIGRFNHTSTALQPQSFGKEFARFKYLVRRL